RANADRSNLLASIHLPIVLVTTDFRIGRFTPTAEKVLNLIPSDVGRPIGHLKPNIVCPDLEKLVADVIESATACEREVADDAGTLYALRIRPYKSADNRIDGA